MVRVLINHYAVTVPPPVITKAVIVRGDGEIVTIEPETLWGSSSQHPDVCPAKAAIEPAMFPGMIEVITAIIPAAVVPNPPAIVVNMGSVWMVIAIAIVALLRYLMVLALVLMRAMRGNVLMMVPVTFMVVIVVPPMISILSKTVN